MDLALFPATHPVRPVLVAVDGSWTAGAVVQATAGTARGAGAPLQLLRVVPPPGGDRRERRRNDAALLGAAAHLDQLRRELVALLPRTPVSAVLRRGRTDSVLVEDSRGTEQVVLGAHRGGPGLGAVAGAVVHRAHAPVLLHRTGGDPAGAVVVGIDGFTGSGRVLARAAEEAVRRGAVLQVVHGRAVRPAPAGAPGWEDSQLDAGRRLIADLLDRELLHHPRLRAQLVVRPQDAAPMLLDAAARARLLVLGRRTAGTGRPSSGTGSALLRYAACPVLLVTAARTGSGEVRRTGARHELVAR